jgi:hypothetical protein
MLVPSSSALQLQLQPPPSSSSSSSPDSRLSFCCQRCLSPLQIDSSFYTMNEHTQAELRLTISPTPEFDPGDPPTEVEGGAAAARQQLKVPKSPFRRLQVGTIVTLVL